MKWEKEIVRRYNNFFYGCRKDEGLDDEEQEEEKKF